MPLTMVRPHVLPARGCRCMVNQGRTAAGMPMRNAAHGATLAQPDVMLTRPARIPLQSATMSYVPVRYLIQRIVVTPAEPAAIVVVTAVRVTSSIESGLSIASAEPGLNPYLQLAVPTCSTCYFTNPWICSARHPGPQYSLVNSALAEGREAP